MSIHGRDFESVKEEGRSFGGGKYETEKFCHQLIGSFHLVFAKYSFLFDIILDTNDRTSYIAFLLRNVDANFKNNLLIFNEKLQIN